MSETAMDLVALGNALEMFVQQTVPAASTVSKYGGLLFTLKPEKKEGQFCGVFLSSKHAKLSFGKGYLLDDPESMLQGNGKYRRHINFAPGDTFQTAYIEMLIRQAAERS